LYKLSPRVSTPENKEGAGSNRDRPERNATDNERQRAVSIVVS
jgi:hypothetical protein